MSVDPFILYIEDDRPLLELIQYALELSGYTVIGASNGGIGLELMRKSKPDLLLLDLMMESELNGWDVYEVMKNDEELADVPIIVITAKIPGDGRVIVEGLPPVEDYITERFDVEGLLRAIKNFV